jgi:hypothetical protein
MRLQKQERKEPQQLTMSLLPLAGKESHHQEGEYQKLLPRRTKRAAMMIESQQPKRSRRLKRQQLLKSIQCQKKASCNKEERSFPVWKAVDFNLTCLVLTAYFGYFVPF